MRQTAIELFLMVAIGIVLGLLGPFGSDALPAAARLAYWVTFIVLGYAIFRPVAALGRALAAETRVPGWLSVALVALVAALPLSALIATATIMVRGRSLWEGERFLVLYAQVAAIGLAIHLLMQALARPGAAAGPVDAAPAAPEATPMTPPGDAFLRRLPPRLGRDLLCLEMEDHYVRAHTRLGSELILMRLSDAVTELDGAGAQVHRSWWVAHGAATALERDGRNARLRLVNGRVVPVSRALLPTARAELRFDSGGNAPQAAGIGLGDAA